MKKASWLHLTDLHFGNKDNEDSWPTIKHAFFKDLETICKDGVDFVLFSGDLAFSGKEKEYAEITHFLTDMWSCFSSLNCNPLFLSVPGNHDLQRPEKLSAVAKMMLRFDEDKEVQKEFWEDNTSEYYSFIHSLFENYCNWYEGLKLPKPNIISGYLPGDFSTSFEINKIKFGIVGLNSAFTHFSNTVKDIFLSPKQLNRVTESLPDVWAKDADISILMTHHPRGWLSASCKHDYDSLIYVPERFYGHFCGHLHEARDYDLSEGGADVRRHRQGMSLFGLDKTALEVKRLHGYSYYTYIKDENGSHEILTPRRATRLQGGTWKLAPDTEFDLNSQCQLVRDISWRTERTVGATFSDKDDSLMDDFDDIKDLSNTSLINFLEDAVLRQLEWRFPKPQERHRRVRGGELAQAQRFLSESKALWVESDWGMGKEDFLGVLFEKIENLDNFIFKLDCDGFEDIESFYHGVEEQFGLELQTFLARINDRYGIYIVFDNIDAELIEKCGDEFARILSIIRDYNSKIYTVCTSRYKNDYFAHVNVKLQPLQSYEIKAYVEGHNDFSRDMLAEDYLDIIHIKSSGIPMIVDNIVSALSVVSIDELSDYDIDIRNAGNEYGAAPASLKLAIKIFSDSNEDTYKRCYNLLKTLSLLPYGESLKKIKYIDRRYPFYVNNVLLLQRFSLVTSSQMLVYSQAGETWSDVDTSERILKVPKQVRDYIISTLDEDEVDNLVGDIADILFGDKWRFGRAKILDSKFVGSRGARGFGPGNEHEIIKQLLRKAIKDDDLKNAEKALRISVAYCIGLSESNRYRDILLSSSEILSLTASISSECQRDIMKQRAKALRMLGRYDESLSIFLKLLDDEWHITNKAKAEIFLNIALIYQSKKEFEDAKKYASKVLTSSDGGKGIKIQAKSIICEIDGGDTEEMNKLEKQARKNNSTIAANNIAYTIACKSSAGVDYKILDRILNTPGDVYNKIRAASKKVIFAFESNNKSIIGRKEEAILAYGYSLYYNQRMKGLFESCHKALWLIYENDKSVVKLSRIFRLSSLLWRLIDKTDSEISYLDKLIEIQRTRDNTTSTYDIDQAYLNSRVSYYKNNN